MMAAFIVLGGCSIGLGAGLRRVCPRSAGPWLVMLGGGATVAAGAVRRDHLLLTGPGFTGESWHNQVHDVVSGVAYAAKLAAPLLLAWRLRHEPGWAVELGDRVRAFGRREDHAVRIGDADLASGGVNGRGLGCAHPASCTARPGRRSASRSGCGRARDAVGVDRSLARVGVLSGGVDDQHRHRTVVQDEMADAAEHRRAERAASA